VQSRIDLPSLSVQLSESEKIWNVSFQGNMDLISVLTLDPLRRLRSQNALSPRFVCSYKIMMMSTLLTLARNRLKFSHVD
jgi:hypothetical protein